MSDETFLLMSLKEEKAKKLAEAISNKTSRKILELLGKKEKTSSNLAKELKLPISTISYNTKLLENAGLIESSEFVWSDKGKQMNIYKLSKKMVIIAPKVTDNLKNQLKSLLPVGLISLAVAGLIKIFYKPIQFMSAQVTPKTEAMTSLNDAIAQSSQTTITQVNYTLWFIYGVITTILIFIFWTILRRSKK